MALALSAAACSVPGVGAAKPSPSPDPYKSALAFSQCMRDHGITDFPDPQFNSDGGGFAVQAGGPGNDKTDLRPDSPQFQAAMAACKSKMPAGGGFANSASGK